MVATSCEPRPISIPVECSLTKVAAASAIDHPAMCRAGEFGLESSTRPVDIAVAFRFEAAASEIDTDIRLLDGSARRRVFGASVFRRSRLGMKC